MAKITDVAKLAGVSKSTVSNVLSEKRFVSDDIKEKVIKACQELNFKPNFYASTLATKSKSRIIGVLMEQAADIDSSPIYITQIKSIIRSATRHQYSILIYNNLEKSLLDQILIPGRLPIDGAIIMAPNLSDVRISEFETNQVPSIVIGRPELNNTSYVDIDNKELIKTVLNDLLEKYSNNVYFINSVSHLTISKDRKDTFINVLEDKGISSANRLFESPNKEDDGYNIAMKYAVKDSLFITTSGHVTKGVYRAIKEKKLSIGKDVGVFALGSSYASSEFDPPLSLASQDYDKLGDCAVNLLIESMEKNQYISKLIKSEIHYNESTNK